MFGRRLVRCGYLQQLGFIERTSEKVDADRKFRGDRPCHTHPFTRILATTFSACRRRRDGRIANPIVDLRRESSRNGDRGQTLLTEERPYDAATVDLRR
jgi:hypothetical protein